MNAVSHQMVRKQSFFLFEFGQKNKPNVTEKDFASFGIICLVDV